MDLPFSLVAGDCWRHIRHEERDFLRGYPLFAAVTLSRAPSAESLATILFLRSSPSFLPSLRRARRRGGGLHTSATQTAPSSSGLAARSSQHSGTSSCRCRLGLDYGCFTGHPQIVRCYIFKATGYTKLEKIRLGWRARHSSGGCISGSNRPIGVIQTAFDASSRCALK